MGSDLNWNADESDREPQWQAAQPVRGPTAAGPRWGLWITAGVVLVLAAAAGIDYFLRRVQQTQDEQRVVITGLAQTAEQRARDGDMETLATLADSLYPGWRQWQVEQRVPRLHPQAGGGQYYGLAWGATALNRYNALDDPVYGDFRLDGEQATLVVTRLYGSQGGGGNFTLRNTDYYRYANGAWVHTEPPAEVWSTMAAPSDTGVSLLVPAHDEAALQPIVPRLQQLAVRACSDLGCGEEPHLIISARVEDLLRPHPLGLANPAYAPAPTLIGEALDDAGRDALYRYYGILLVRHIAGSLAIGDEARVMEELVRLGLEAPES